jgi:hypothetical protein
MKAPQMRGFSLLWSRVIPLFVPKFVSSLWLEGFYGAMRGGAAFACPCLCDTKKHPSFVVAKPATSKKGHTGPMRSKPMRSRPMRGKWPRYIDGQLTTRPRPQASKRGLWRAAARATRPSETFAGCFGARDRHSPDRYRAHGAWCARASIDHDPSPCPRLGRDSRRVAERPRGADQVRAKQLVAGRSRPSRKTTRTGPDRLLLLVDLQQRCDRTCRLDRHANSPPFPCRHPGSATRTGMERVERSS